MHPRQSIPGQIGPSTARNHRGNLGRICGGNQSGGRAGAGSEESDRQIRQTGLSLAPLHHVRHTTREQTDVEAKLPRHFVNLFLVFGQQIHEQGSHPLFIDLSGHEAVARTMTAAPAAVGEDDQPFRLFGQSKVAMQGDTG